MSLLLSISGGLLFAFVLRNFCQYILYITYSAVKHVLFQKTIKRISQIVEGSPIYVFLQGATGGFHYTK